MMNIHNLAWAVCLLGLAAAANLEDLSKYQLSCACDGCCEVPILPQTEDPTAPRVKQVIAYTGGNATLYKGASFHTVAANLLGDYELTNYDLASASTTPIDCTHSKAVASSESGPTITVSLENKDNVTCRVSWDGKFEDQAAYSRHDDYVILFLLTDLLPHETFETQLLVYPDWENGILTQDMLDDPNYEINSFELTDEDGIYTTELVLETSGCPLPRYVDFIYGSCTRSNIVAKARGDGLYSYNQTMSLDELRECATEEEVDGDQITISLDARPSIQLPNDVRCDRRRPTVPEEGGFLLGYDTTVDAPQTGLSVGAIVGIILGALAFLFIYFLGKRCYVKRQVRRTSDPVPEEDPWSHDSIKI
mmetsp:Transcript_9632/g.18148  ORF Transcript_9632/g.18148 Transcript_9632/m.18148 type:complete len:364 (+) Transcript_9632:67-1158(+)